MGNQNLIKAQCASCDGRGIPEKLQPYCSVVCLILGRSGLRWRVNPYQILEIESGNQVVAGPAFDLTAKAIADLQKHADRGQENIGHVMEQLKSTLVSVTSAGVGQ